MASSNVLVKVSGVFGNDSASNKGYNHSLDIRSEEEEVSESLLATIAVGTVLGLINLTTILGNLLVCVTIASNKRLQNATNYFICSLAACDLLLGVLVLPFSNVNTLFPDDWPLGPVFCNIFVSTDVMLCTISILNLFAISLERYLAVTKPYLYVRWTTHKNVGVVLAAIWVFSFAMAFIPIHMGWNTADGSIQNYANPQLCLFDGNAAYVLLVSIGTYFTPLVIMCAVYIKVFAVAKRQVERIKELTISQQHVMNGSKVLDGSSPRHRGPPSPSEGKATVTLATVILAFTVCWVPYFVLFTARPFVPQGFPPKVDLFTLWLGYVNSMLNPFVYAFHSSEFRYGFMLVLCRRRALRHRARNPEAYFL
jgi:histamine receptor H2